MNRQLLYQEDVLKLEFEANVIQKIIAPGGAIGIILDQTYFYPTGGGQEHDTGWLGEARVLDVYKEGQPIALVHIVDRDLPLGSVKGLIDQMRRLRHMQHHTAQHLLTQCFVRLLGCETVSANINGNSPSTLDLEATTVVNKTDLVRVENLANAIVYENRVIKTYFVEPEEVRHLPLRKPPPAVERIRIVEIDGYDYAACGGTHCTQTGMIGAIKILKAERQNDKVRISFVAGWQALEHYQTCYQTISDLSSQMSVGITELAQAMQRQAEQLKLTQREVQALKAEKLALEARQMAVDGQAIGERRLILAGYQNRPPSELRALADELKKMPGIIALLASFDEHKVSLVVTCAPDTGFSARELLSQILETVGGRGGGDRQIAQGGGTVTEEQYQLLLKTAETKIIHMLAG